MKDRTANYFGMLMELTREVEDAELQGEFVKYLNMLAMAWGIQEARMETQCHTQLPLKVVR